MDIILRKEQPKDHLEVELLTREAFWYMELPDRIRCDEHFLAHILRESDAFLPSLDYVAVLDGRIVGNIMYAQSKVTDASGADHSMLTFGPLSVLPSMQGRGVGTLLVQKTVGLAKKLPYPAILIFGHPDYYHRFGFKGAAEYGITTSDGTALDALMALELRPGALTGISGRFYEGSAYEIDDDAFAEFEKTFPKKEGG